MAALKEDRNREIDDQQAMEEEGEEGEEEEAAAQELKLLARLLSSYSVLQAFTETTSTH